MAADPEGILTGACSSLGWSKTSHPSETPEDNDGWSSTEEPVNSSDAEEEGARMPALPRKGALLSLRVCLHPSI